MARYIRTDELLKTARDGYHSDFGRSMADLTSLREVIEDTPTADVVEVKHGKWIMDEIERQRFGKWGYLEDHKHYCSCCNKEALHSYGDDCCDSWWYLSDYCPNCGARMNGGTNNE